MNNIEIAAVMDEMAELLELHGENAFRVRAYRTGAKAISALEESVADIIKAGDTDLTELDGIGSTLAEKCTTLVTTGKLPQLEKLREETPLVLIQMTRIPGLGVKKALVLHKELGVASLEDLKVACEAGKVQALKGFAAKTEKAILAGLEIAQAASQRIRLDQAEKLVERLRLQLKSDVIEKIEFAGSFRRGKETVGDIDILVVSKDHKTAMDLLEQFPGRVSTIVRGDTKMSIRVDEQFQVDLRVVPSESFGAALQYFTGSKEHNVAVRSRARKLGMTVNEYGVSKLDSPDDYVAGETEESVYAALGLQWVAPELREGRQELTWAADGGEIPDLVQLQHVVSDLHMHTTATDGAASIGEMADAARQRGLAFIAITDHSKRVSMAMGLDEARLLQQWEQIDHYNASQSDGFRVLKGIECDILEAGGMDLSDEVLAQADWVIGSVHYGQKQPREQITERILGALENPHVDIIAHPTGRLLGSRPPYEVDLQAVIDSAAQYGKALELNASPRRLDLSEENLIQAVRAGVPIAINTDAHSIDGLSVMRFGITQARRAGIKKDQVINTWSLEKLLAWLKR